MNFTQHSNWSTSPAMLSAVHKDEVVNKNRERVKGGISKEDVTLYFLEKGEEKFKEQNYLESLESFKKALRTLRKNGNNHLRARILLNKARCLEKLGKWEEALSDLLETLRLSTPVDPLPEEGDIFRELADLYARRGHIELARKIYKRALDIFSKNSSLSGEAKVLTSMGALYFEEGEMEQSLSCYKKAYKTAVKLNENKLKATLLSNMGIVFSVSGDIRKATLCYKKSLTQHKKIGNLLGVSQVYHNLGMAMRALERYQMAIGYFKRSITLSRKLGEKNLQAISLLSLSDVLIHMNEKKGISQYINQALKYLKEQGDNLGIAEAWKLKGILAMKKRHWKEAEGLLLKSAMVFKKYRNPLGEAETYRELGVLYSYLGRKEKTWEWLEQSFEIFRQLKASLDLEGVKESLQRLERVYLEVLRNMGKEVERKDPYTYGHSERVAAFSLLIAQQIGYPREKWKGLVAAAYLHDLGKVMIPDKILKKPGKLTDAEYTIIKEHPVIALDLLKQVEFPWEVKPLIRHHHERWDGKGYPDGIKQDEIPLGARIISVADTFDAITSARPYRGAMPLEKALSIIENAGEVGQLDPKISKEFISALRDNPELFEEISSGHKTSVEMLWLEKTGIEAEAQIQG